MIGYINIRTFATLLPYPSDPEFSKSNIRSVRIKSDTLAALMYSNIKDGSKGNLERAAMVLLVLLKENV